MNKLKRNKYSDKQTDLEVTFQIETMSRSTINSDTENGEKGTGILAGVHRTYPGYGGGTLETGRRQVSFPDYSFE